MGRSKDAYSAGCKLHCLFSLCKDYQFGVYLTFSCRQSQPPAYRSSCAHAVSPSAMISPQEESNRLRTSRRLDLSERLRLG